MQKILFSTLAVAGFVNAAVDSTGAVITHSDSLKCGRCIDGGFNYCVRQVADDGNKRNTNPSDQKCCKDVANCANMGYGDWLCSGSYNNPIYAKNVCPFDTRYCGASRTVNFAKAGEKASAGVTDLPFGESCSFMIKSTCGAVSMNAAVASGKVSVGMLEWDSASIVLNGTVVKGAGGKDSKNAELQAAAPASMYPKRDATFGYMLSQNAYLTATKNPYNSTEFQNGVNVRVQAAMTALNAGWTGKSTPFVNNVWNVSQTARDSKRKMMTAALNGGKGPQTANSTSLTSNAAGKKVLETVAPGTATLTGNQMNCASRTLFVTVTSEATDNSGKSTASMNFTSMAVTAPSVKQTAVNSTNAVMNTLTAIVGVATLMWF